MGINTHRLISKITAEIYCVLETRSKINGENDDCNHDRYKIVTPSQCMFIAGIVLLGLIGLNIIIVMIDSFAFSIIQRYSIGRACLNNERYILLINMFTLTFASIFYLFWAIIGIGMYSNEMSTSCQDSFIGIMVLLWSAIVLMITGLCLLPAYCAVCYTNRYMNRHE